MVIEEIMLGISAGGIAAGFYVMGEMTSSSKLDKVIGKYRKEFFDTAFPMYNIEIKKRKLLNLYQKEIEELNSLKHLFPAAKKRRRNMVRELKSMTGYEEAQVYITGLKKSESYASF